MNIRTHGDRETKTKIVRRERRIRNPENSLQFTLNIDVFIMTCRHFLAALSIWIDKYVDGEPIIIASEVIPGTPPYPGLALQLNRLLTVPICISQSWNGNKIERRTLFCLR